MSSTRTTKPLHGKHVLPDLPYSHDALEPVISRAIMTVHHQEDHATYVKELNLSELEYDEAIKTGDLSRAIALQAAIKYNGGGHINHSIFWTNLAPKSQGGGGKPAGELLAHIERTWGSFEAFKATFNAAAVGVHGSGWCWLGYNRATDGLEIATCANQDPLESTTGLIPLLGLDVWEHAYFNDYSIRRGEYCMAMWQIFNWQNVTERYDAAKSMAHAG